LTIQVIDPERLFRLLPLLKRGQGGSNRPDPTFAHEQISLPKGPGARVYKKPIREEDR
jgi:hypothetical protein